jgi:hypothetical protein
MSTDDRTATLLRERFADATRHLTAPPGVVERAAGGGRRRLRRRRAARALVTTTVAVAVVVAVSSLAVRNGGLDAPRPEGQPAPPPADWSGAPPAGADVLRWLYDRPPRGDLARDTAYVADVVAAWDGSHAASANAARGIFRDLRGEPRVVWAGRTPAGPAAVVVQRAVFHAHSEGGVTPGAGTVVGYVGVAGNGRPRLVADDYQDRRVNEPTPWAWFVDPGRDVVAVLDLGVPAAWTDGWRYHEDGVRELGGWTPLKFRHGIATFRIDGDKWWKARVSWRPYGEAASMVYVARDGGVAPTGTKLPWPAEGGPYELFIQGLSPTRLEDPLERFTAALNERQRGTERGGGYPMWSATGRLPDGTEVVVSDIRLDDDPSHAYALLIGRDGTTRVVHGGAVDPAATLPVAVHLPDGQGTVVVRDGARLAWRSPSGWVDFGGGAGLVPDGVTQVRVTTDSGPPAVVTLPG